MQPGSTHIQTVCDGRGRERVWTLIMARQKVREHLDGGLRGTARNEGEAFSAVEAQRL